MTSSHNEESEVRPSVETNHAEMDGEYSGRAEASERAKFESEDRHEDIEDSSVLSDGTDDTHDPAQADDSYLGDPEYADSHVRADDAGDASSHHEATDEDVFSDKSPRSSLGSYDAVSESDKAYKDFDNRTTTTRSPRISDFSQYDREYEKGGFIPTVRGTPRPPFRTSSDVRATQMSSPSSSVLGSPRSAKKQFPTVSRLGTPTASAQYSPKRMSTPPRFKGRKEAPLVLLHVTLLPLRWAWGNLLNNLDTNDVSEQLKTLQESWRLLQDRIGDTVIERGILLGHPQNDYEVLEERLLEALELPFRRRARILECGHYLGPANESSLTEDEESEDEWSSQRSRAGDKRHWCDTCKSEIRGDSLGSGKIFRVKVYASNGLMRAGAWEACWKEMERVDVELEPIVEPILQEELVRLAAARQDAGIQKDGAHHLGDQNRREQEGANFRFRASSPQPELSRVGTPVSTEERRRQDEERLREIYGHSPPQQSREPSVHPDQGSHIPQPSSSPPSQPDRTYKSGNPHQATYQNASLPELLLQSVRVLIEDRRNVAIFTLSLFVLILAFRNAPTPAEPVYEPVIHRMRDAPIVRRAQGINTPQLPTVQIKYSSTDSLATSSICVEPSMTSQQQASLADTVVVTPDQEWSEAMQRQDAPVSRPMEAASVEDEQNKSEVESILSQEPTSMTSGHYTAAAQPEPTAVEPDYEGNLETTSLEDLHASESTLAVGYEKPVAEEPEQETIQVETETDAAPIPYGQAVKVATESTTSQVRIAAATSVSTVYEPCNIFGGAYNQFVYMALQSEQTETVTERKVIRVLHTVTETEVETATETVKIPATDVSPEATPSVAADDIPLEESIPTTLPELEEEATGVEESTVAEAAAEDIVS
ncbi:uncharacterized protein F4812DRAFT_412326 [Daldinia caldariorum]|uniref:uncharacterized protein n=1 Tax=Daldinia caldariorum TaxID=326644 RepID=UPI002008BB98|nr:uncharacterized protein F4812DRAFT_412326 [Daldinia caldariorum]KAI1471001.1 hypothetical protein F4812DRAFT_412326 [Daldinia caldariorum]